MEHFIFSYLHCLYRRELVLAAGLPVFSVLFLKYFIYMHPLAVSPFKTFVVSIRNQSVFLFSSFDSAYEVIKTIRSSSGS